MSGTNTPGGPRPDHSGPPGSGGSTLPGGPDPSMEDILASIRRILSEDEHAGERGPGRHEPPGEPQPPEVFNLDASMIVEEQPPPSTPTAPEPFRTAPAGPDLPELRQTEPEPPQVGSNAGPDALVAPAAAAAAALSIGSLRRKLDAERQPGPRGGSITVEELVREALRPMLKTWLDENLPPIVERLVRAEIERVVGRSDS